MKNIFFNSKKALEEKRVKEEMALANKEESNYLDNLKKDELFQKYIIEKRIKAPIKLLDTIQNLPKENRDLEVEIRKGTINALKGIFHSIVNV